MVGASSIKIIIELMKKEYVKHIEE